MFDLSCVNLRRDKAWARSFIIFVFISPLLEFTRYIIREAVRSVYNFGYDASIALVLALSDGVLDVCPLSVTALCNQALLNWGLGFNLLNELSDDFIDGVLVVLVWEDVEHGTSLNLCEAVISKRGFIILIEVNDELVLLTVELLLKFLGEGLELVRNALEGFLLLGAHLRIDVVDGGDECTVRRVDGLLHAQLNVHQVTFECLN